MAHLVAAHPATARNESAFGPLRPGADVGQDLLVLLRDFTPASVQV